MVGAFPSNSYDGRILLEQLEQIRILLADSNAIPQQMIVDLGFRGVDTNNPAVEIIHLGKYKPLMKQQQRWLAIEPDDRAIGWIADVYRGNLGDAPYAVMCKRVTTYAG